MLKNSQLFEKYRPSQFLEKFSPTFKEQMRHLREVDFEIRESADKLQPLLKYANRNFSRKEYLKSFANMVSFYEGIKEINDRLMKVKYKIKAPAQELLTSELTDEEKELLLKSKPKKASVELHKRAGVFDFLSNLFTKKYWALSALEDKFSDKELAKFKNSLGLLNSLGLELFGNLKQNLKNMASARAGREIAKYFEAADDFHKSFRRFDKQFLKTSELAGPFVKYLEDLDIEEKRKEAEEAAKKREAEFAAKQEEQRALEQLKKEEQARLEKHRTSLTNKPPTKTAPLETEQEEPFSTTPDTTKTLPPPISEPLPAKPIPTGKPPAALQVEPLTHEEEAKQEQAQELEKQLTKLPPAPELRFTKVLQNLEKKYGPDTEDAPSTIRSPGSKAANHEQLIEQLIKIADQYPNAPQKLMPVLLEYSNQLEQNNLDEENQKLLAIMEGIADENFLD